MVENIVTMHSTIKKLGTTPNEPWDDQRFIQEALNSRLRHPSFGNFKKIIEESKVLQQTNFEFEIIYGRPNLPNEIKIALRNEHLATISFSTHAGVVVEYNNDVLTYYDPWPEIDDFETKKIDEIPFNNDLLVFTLVQNKILVRRGKLY